MIVVDTNVLSEVLKPIPFPSVLRWFEEQEPETVFTTAITQAEILAGIERLPVGKRRQKLAHSADAMFRKEFDTRILAFDEDAAVVFARIVGARLAAGRPISLPDAMIAAISRSHGASLATRNTTDFEICGIDLIDPWTTGG